MTLHPTLRTATFTGIYNLPFISKARAVFRRICENYSVVFANAAKRCAKVTNALSATGKTHDRCNVYVAAVRAGQKEG